MPPPHTIVLAIDGFRASALGAYGGATPTPELNQLASQSAVFDWHFASAPELERVYASLWEGEQGSLATLLAAGEHESVLATDDPLVAASSAAKHFNALGELTLPEVTSAAEEVAATWLAEAVLGDWTHLLTQCREQATPNRPQFLWLHTRGLHGPWDAPAALVEALVDEEDPEITMSVAPAAGVVSSEDPDAAFSASCRYTAQVQVLDACIGQFVAFVDELFGDEPTQLVLLGTRGYALGEHGIIGGDDRLYAESLHTPLMVRRSDGEGQLLRIAQPLGPESLLGVLAGGLVDEGAEEAGVVQSSKQGAWAIQQGEWRLLLPAGSSESEAMPELYLKPDDRWEANDVASLMPGVVDRLQAMLSPAADVASSGDSN